jgi:hypothetical protein
MSTFRNLLCLGLAAAAVSAAPAMASTSATATTPASAPHAATTSHPATVTHPATASHAATTATARPTASVARPQAATVSSAPQAANRVGSSGRMVRTRLSNGKYVTLNCSLAGNQNKQACRR